MADEPRESLEAVRLEKLEKIAALGIDPWGQRFDGHQAIAAVRALPVPTEPASEPAGPTVRVAGRIMLRRGQGKVYFLELRDWTDRIQIFVGKKQVGDEGWSLVDLLDLGDLIGVDGRLGYTKTGELTVFAEKITFLTKSLLPPPEKWHGLTDIEQRYRQRYVDLFSNPESLAVFIARSKLIASFRRTMAAKGFLEVETPTMQAIAGGAAARPFITHHNALDLDLFLRIALELHLKRLLVGGMERVFEIGRVYRNEGLSPRHNPEFTMMEAYQSYANYEVMMDLTEASSAAPSSRSGAAFCGLTAKRPSTSRRHGLAAPTPTCYGNSRASTRLISRALESKAESCGIATAGKDPDVVTSELFEAVVEEHLTGPLFVIDYPRRSVRSRSARLQTRESPSGSSSMCTASSWPTPTPS